MVEVNEAYAEFDAARGSPECPKTAYVRCTLVNSKHGVVAIRRVLVAADPARESDRRHHPDRGSREALGECDDAWDSNRRTHVPVAIERRR
jgi:hypothetical protein